MPRVRLTVRADDGLPVVPVAALGGRDAGSLAGSRVLGSATHIVGLRRVSGARDSWASACHGAWRAGWAGGRLRRPRRRWCR
jgi:hypothetical protein